MPIPWKLNELAKLALVVFVAVLDLQQTAYAENTSFVLKDSGFLTSSQHRIYWLDNDRVIFTGYDLNLEKIDKQGRYAREQNIYIWDTRESRRSIYVKNASLSCYFRGYIRYSILEGPLKKGLMGQERTYLDLYYSKETWEGEPPEWEEGVKVHPITCKSFRSKQSIKAGYIIEMLPEHGFLEVPILTEQESVSSSAQLRLHTPNRPDSILLPLTRSDINIGETQYVEFLDAYAMHGKSLVSVRGGDLDQLGADDLIHAVWILYSDGHLKELRVPGPSYGGWHAFYPASEGVFVASHGQGKLKGFPGDAGGFWIKGNREEKVISGEIASLSIKVSPNGCKIAFVSQPYENRRPFILNSTLHILQVCKGGN